MPWHFQPLHIIVPSPKTANAANIADHINSQGFSTLSVNGIYSRVVAAKTVTLAPHAHAPVLVSSTGSWRRVIEPMDDSANRASSHVAKQGRVCALEQTLSCFHDKRAKWAGTRTKALDHDPLDGQPCIHRCSWDCLTKNDPEMIGAVHYEPLLDRDTHISRHKDVKKKMTTGLSSLARLRFSCLMITRNTANSAWVYPACFSLCGTAIWKRWVSQNIALSVGVRIHSRYTLHAIGRSQRSERLRKWRLIKCFCRETSTQLKHNGLRE